MSERATAEDAGLAAVILRLLHARAPGASVCPSEVARAAASDWRPLMPEVRRAAQALVAEGRLQVTQGEQRVDAIAARGPIRLRLPPKA